MKKILILAATALVLFACTREDESSQATLQKGDRNTVFYAKAEGTPIPGTKVYADGQLRLLWNKNDYISIFNYRTVNDQYKFQGEDGDTGGYFDLEFTDGSTGSALPYVYAVYPYGIGPSINNTGTEITVNLPWTQTYLANSFGRGANVMVAVSEDNFLSFKNACGYLKLRLYGENTQIKRIEIVGNNNEPLSGKAYIVPSLDNPPVLTMASNDVYNWVALHCSTAVTLGSSSENCTEFIFALPPMTFSNGFTIYAISPQGVYYEKSTTQSLTITRNTMETMSPLEINIPEPVTFTTAAFKDYCVACFDTNGDGVISTTEALAVTQMSFIDNAMDEHGPVYYYSNGQHHCNTSSLGGIEAFKNLERLSITGVSEMEYCSINSIDLSQNTALKTLSFDYSVIGTINLTGCSQLETFVGYWSIFSQLQGVNTCTALKRVDVFSTGSQSFTTVPDFQYNTNLEELSIPGSGLTSINLTNLTKLKTLDITDNSISAGTLDVSALTSLEVLRVRNCSLNSLTGYAASDKIRVLDVGNNNIEKNDWYFTQSNLANLEKLEIDNNKIRSVYITGLPKLTYLKAWPQKVDFQLLWCTESQYYRMFSGDSPTLYLYNSSGTRLTSADYIYTTYGTSIDYDITP